MLFGQPDDPLGHIQIGPSVGEGAGLMAEHDPHAQATELKQVEAACEDSL